MPKKYKKHLLAPDRVYNDTIVAKLINYIMKQGKKATAQNIVYQAFDAIREKTKKEPLEVFKEAVKNASPLLEVKPMRIGGATYQVPREVKGDRKIALALRWMVEAARAKKGKPTKEKLSEEIIAASANAGEAVRKKVNVHKMAEANRAFAHFAK